MGRMLLSHNYNLTEPMVPSLTRSQFAQVFVDGFAARNGVAAAEIEHPHWMLELKFDEGIEAAAIGRACAEILLAARQKQREDGVLDYDTLVLGGLKLTPPMGSSPVGLQTGEWGVDVVETATADAFLKGINWAAIAATKQPGQVFETIATKGALSAAS